MAGFLLLRTLNALHETAARSFRPKPQNVFLSVFTIRPDHYAMDSTKKLSDSPFVDLYVCLGGGERAH
jgi:hypothetical protein